MITRGSSTLVLNVLLPDESNDLRSITRFSFMIVHVHCSPLFMMNLPKIAAHWSAQNNRKLTTGIRPVLKIFEFNAVGSWDFAEKYKVYTAISCIHEFIYIYMRACIYKKMKIFKNKPKLFRLWACLRLARPGPQMLTYTTSSLTPSSAKLGPDERAVDVISTLWLFNVAMENSPFIDDLWWLTYQTWWFSMATLNN